MIFEIHVYDTFDNQYQARINYIKNGKPEQIFTKLFMNRLNCLRTCDRLMTAIEKNDVLDHLARSLISRTRG